MNRNEAIIKVNALMIEILDTRPVNRDGVASDPCWKYGTKEQLDALRRQSLLGDICPCQCPRLCTLTRIYPTKGLYPPCGKRNPPSFID